MDMLYRGVTGPITITDTGKGTKTTIEQKGFADSCVWSPYGNEDMVRFFILFIFIFFS